MKSLSLIISLFCLVSVASANTMDELDPKNPNIEEVLNKYDEQYERETGLSAHIESDSLDKKRDCFRQSCQLWIQVSLTTQRMYVWFNGVYYYEWKISSGAKGHETPTMDLHPNGRIYDAYSSKAYPEGDYKGLGNMPYAFFLTGGYAIHGTTTGNWKKLGTPASHGCIRLHPDNAQLLNQYVRAYGISNVWVTIHY